MKALLILFAAPACIGLPTELELFASTYDLDQDLKYGSGDIDGHSFGVSLHFPITYETSSPGATWPHPHPEPCHALLSEGTAAALPASQLPAVVPGTSPQEAEEHDHAAHELWYESDKFLAWIERLVLVILAGAGALAGKKGLDVHTERKRRRNNG